MNEKLAWYDANYTLSMLKTCIFRGNVIDVERPLDILADEVERYRQHGHFRSWKSPKARENGREC